MRALYAIEKTCGNNIRLLELGDPDDLGIAPVTKVVGMVQDGPDARDILSGFVRSQASR